MAGRLQRKRAVIVRELLRGRTQTDAVRAAGYSEQTARARSGDIIRLPAVQSLLTAAMRRAGLTPDTLARSVREAMGATIVSVLRSGKAVETDIPDHKIRLQAFDRAARAYGYLRDAEATAAAAPAPPVAFTVNFVAPKPTPHSDDADTITVDPP